MSYTSPTSDQMTTGNGVTGANYYDYWSRMPSPPYSPSNGKLFPRLCDLTMSLTSFLIAPSPLSESSNLDFTNQQYDAQHDQSLISHSNASNSPAISNSPFESLPTTPKSEEHVTTHLPGHYSYRPAICVDTALLLQSNHYDNATIGSASHEVSPGLLSPHSFIESKPLQRRHSHSRSVGDKGELSLGDVSPSSRLGRGHQRNKSAPTSRHQSPYQRFEIAKNVSNIRSISPTAIQQPCGVYHPNKDHSPVSPSESVGRQVATDRIRKASTDRRKYQPKYVCIFLRQTLPILT
jgi:hypothetical protein